MTREVSQEDDGRVSHARLELAVDYAEHVGCCDLLVHHHARVATEDARVPVHRSKRAMAPSMTILLL
jgi:hypothetical protein